jgi:hypothetical protein
MAKPMSGTRDLMRLRAQQDPVHVRELGGVCIDAMRVFARLSIQSP